MSIEKAMDTAKSRIRERVSFQSHVFFSTSTIGYGRNLDENGLNAKETQELLDHGFQYPFNGCIRETFGEYLLQHDLEGSYTCIKSRFGIQLETFTENRLVVLLELAFHFGSKDFGRMKKFISAVKKEEWDTALYDLRVIENKVVNAEVWEQYLEMFRNG